MITEAFCINSNWKVGGKNFKQEYGCFKTTFYPAFPFLLNLVHIRCIQDGYTAIQLK